MAGRIIKIEIEIPEVPVRVSSKKKPVKKVSKKAAPKKKATAKKAVKKTAKKKPRR